MDLEHLPITTVRGNPRNPKDHDVGLLHTSVDELGFLEPIVRDDRTGMLISGHGRVKTLLQKQAQGDSPPAGVTVDPDSGEWLVPVVTGWSSASDRQAEKALIILNRAGEAGGWDPSLLSELLAEMAEDNDLTGTGYDAQDLDRLLEDVAGWDADGFDAGDPSDREPTSDEVTVFSFGVVKFGMYRFEVPIVLYQAWIEAIKQEHGFHNDDVIHAVKQRMGLFDVDIDQAHDEAVDRQDAPL